MNRRKKYSDGLELFGGFENLLRSQILRGDNPIDFISGLYEGTSMGHKQGYEEGFGIGTENAIKSFITSGDKQFFVTSDKIYPFSNTESLFQNEDTKAHIKEFILKPKITKLELNENQYNLFTNNFNQSLQQEINEIQNSLQNISTKSKSNIKSKATIESENRLNYLLNTQLEQILEDTKNSGREQIKNKMKLIKGTNLSTPLSDFAKSNDTALKQLEEKYRESTPNKTEAKEIKQRTKLKNMIHKHLTIDENINLKSETDSLKLKIEKMAPDYKLKKEFNKKRTGDTSIFVTDKFNIYNVENIRKLYPKKVEDVIEKIEKSKEANIDISTVVSDFRSKPIKHENIQDYIKIPNMKIKSKDVFDEYMNKKFNNNIPSDVQNYILALRNQKL